MSVVASRPAAAVSMVSLITPTSMPWRAAAARSMTASSCVMPATCSTLMSCAPCTPPIAAAARSATDFRISRSGPKTFTARSLFTPEISSFTRSAIGCENEYRKPGTWPRSAAMASTSSVLSRPPPHGRRGLSVTNTSVCSGPIGSSLISARPDLQTTVDTSGKASSRFSR